MISLNSALLDLYKYRSIDEVKIICENNLNISSFRRAILNSVRKHKLQNSNVEILEMKDTISKITRYSHEVRYDFIKGDYNNLIIKAQMNKPIISVDFSLFGRVPYINSKIQIKDKNILYFYDYNALKKVGDIRIVKGLKEAVVFEVDGEIYQYDLTKLTKIDTLPNDIKLSYGTIGFSKNGTPIKVWGTICCL